ncbi:MAG: tetratricopeptide repeat protein [Deltaproteobacteria bacterium]|nr:tetratricopeptide repeat protein [Deltaproteobacteria bacterium]
MQGRLAPHARAASLLTLLILARSSPALAQAKATDAARAETLYDEALALVEKGRHAEACPKLAESQRLDPALGTQFNLADCYEHIGKPATALAMFRDVERAARAAGKSNLESSARQRAEKLGPKTPKLRVVVEAPTEGASLQIDGAPSDLAAAAAGTIPVDPGAHVLRVTAPRHIAWQGTVTAGDAGVVEAKVPALAEETVEALPPPVTFTMTRKIGIGVAGLGVVALGVGSVFGLMAVSKKSEATRSCGSADPKSCQLDGDVGLWSDAKTLGNVSTVTFVAGGVLIAGAAALWFLGAPSRSTPVVTGGIDPNGGGSLGLRGVW